MLWTQGPGAICASNNWLHQAVLQHCETCHIRVFLGLCGFFFSFCPQFLSSVIAYLSQRAASHLARFEISFQSLAFAVYEEILLLPRVIHRKVIFMVILGLVLGLIS